MKDRISCSSTSNMGLLQEAKEMIGLRGWVRITQEDESGRKVIFNKANLVVNGGRALLASHLGATGAAAITTLKLGQNGNNPGDITSPLTPSPTQDSLNDPSPLVVTQVAESPVYVNQLPEISTRFIFTLEKNVGNGGGSRAYTEAGLFSSGGTMFAVENFPAMVKTPTRKFIFEWTVYF